MHCRSRLLLKLLLVLVGLLLIVPWAARAQTPPPVAVTYLYDGAGRLVRADYDNGPSILYLYDAAGNMLQRRVATLMQVYLPVLLKFR